MNSRSIFSRTGRLSPTFDGLPYWRPAPPHDECSNRTNRRTRSWSTFDQAARMDPIKAAEMQARLFSGHGEEEDGSTRPAHAATADMPPGAAEGDEQHDEDDQACTQVEHPLSPV